MIQEVDALATARGAEQVSVLVWRHADDHDATASGDADVTLHLERLPFSGRVRVDQWRIDAILPAVSLIEVRPAR